MHEYSVVESLLLRIADEARRHRAKSVSRVAVRIGRVSGVEPALFETAFRCLRENTVCAGAELQIEIVTATFQCVRCDVEFESEDPCGSLCPRCDLPARLRSGDELSLERIELEVPVSEAPRE
ncbi:MAG TPA: hydrogenase maturation nickel metallochaperone HypA [Polyangiaceae bacterium]|nr:hydrogenase maturation nickel metallochaperone HypA [Polyangiaceae bacterium]